MNIKNFLKFILGKGIRIGYSTGKPFDPRNQKRTDPIRDMVLADIKKEEEKKKKRKEK